jgi:lisH domain-containing protein FOPNL
MSSVEDFKSAVRDSLQQNGDLPKIQAQIRAQIISSMEASCSGRPPVQTTSDTYLINELIREYLEFHGYRSSASVFVPESGLSMENRVERDRLAEQMNIQLGSNSRKLPLLYAMAARSRANGLAKVGQPVQGA